MIKNVAIYFVNNDSFIYLFQRKAKLLSEFYLNFFILNFYKICYINDILYLILTILLKNLYISKSIYHFLS